MVSRFNVEPSEVRGAQCILAWRQCAGFSSIAWCGSATLGLVAGPQEAALAQDAQRPVCVAAADADTGYVHTMGDILGGRVLIGARNGLFLAHEAGGRITVSRAGDADTGRVLSTQAFAGGALIGGWNGVFLAREASGKVTIARAGDADTGPVHLMHSLASAGVLVGAENGLFLARERDGKVSVAPAGDVSIARVYYMLAWPSGGVLVAGAGDGFWYASRTAL